MSRKQKSTFDIEIGYRVRQLRTLNKLAPEVLGDKLGVSRTTVQRYESGEIPLTAEALNTCAKSLNAPVAFFYGEENSAQTPSNTNKLGLLIAAEIMELPDDTLRKTVFQLVRTLNKWSEAGGKDAA